MVLLTSSAISVAISSGVVCLFTFLLFLSGYVLQQQTVKSLQEALQAPIEVRVRLSQGYQREFESTEDVLFAVAEGNDAGIGNSEPLEKESEPASQSVEIVLEQPRQQDSQSSIAASKELTAQQLWHAQVDRQPSNQPNTDAQITIKPSSPPPLSLSSPSINQDLSLRLAYVLSLPTLSDLCSALLFTKYHRQHSPTSNQFNIIYLYPSNWETTPKNPTYKDALTLLIESERQYSVLLHPVQISKVWTGINVETQLLSELARNPWIYDRVMYLRSPGILVDAARLDEVLVQSYVDSEVVKKQWTRLKAPVRRGAAMSLRPDVLLFAQGRGLMVPTGASAGVIAQSGGNKGIEDVGVSGARDAAYVLFEEDELGGMVEKGGRDDLLARFQRERRAVCEGTVLLS